MGEDGQGLDEAQIRAIIGLAIHNVCLDRAGVRGPHCPPMCSAGLRKDTNVLKPCFMVEARHRMLRHRITRGLPLEQALQVQAYFDTLEIPKPELPYVERSWAEIQAITKARKAAEEAAE